MADYGVYDKMENVFKECKGKVVFDSAFKLPKADFLIKSYQQDPMGKAQDLVLNRAATAARQSSEHGMRMIQGQFPRLCDCLELDEFGERKIVLNLMVLLYNYQTYKVGINHIQNLYMSNTPGFESYSRKKGLSNTTGFQSYIRNKGFHGYKMTGPLSVTANAVFE